MAAKIYNVDTNVYGDERCGVTRRSKLATVCHSGHFGLKPQCPARLVLSACS
ncbi:MAG: hypothetical protein ACK4SY_09780 [Pyrobaculum sp.]